MVLRKLCSAPCGGLNGQETRGRGAVCVRTPESLSWRNEHSLAKQHTPTNNAEEGDGRDKRKGAHGHLWPVHADGWQPFAILQLSSN